MGTFKIESKIRIEYYGQMLFFAIATWLILGAIFLDSFFNSRVLHWVVAFVISFGIYAVGLFRSDEERQRKIIITNSGILVNYFFIKDRLIGFEEIEKVTTRRKQFISRGIALNDGFKETVFEIRSQNPIIVGQDKFENYRELVDSIILNLKK